MKRLILFVALLWPSLLFAQLARYDTITLSPSGLPVPVSVSVCSWAGLQTTAAQVTGNAAILTMASNPITAGFSANMQIVVSGFTGGDTYFNSGTLAPFTSTVSITSVSSTTIIFPLTHANASASTNGSVFQLGTGSTPCAPLASIFSDAAGTVPITQPGLTSSGTGNVGFFVAAGNYGVEYSGNTIGNTLQPLTLACPVNAVGVCSTQTMDTIPSGVNFIKHSWVEGPLPVVYNGDFENFPGLTPILPPPDWSPNPNMTCSYETVTPYEGLRSLKCIANTAGSGAGVFTFSVIPVVPGETFYIQGAVKTDGVVTANVVLRWARADGQSTTNFPGDALIASSTSGSWTVISATGVAPSNAVTANIELISTPFGVAGTTWFDSISAYRVSYPGPISASTLTGTGLTPGNCVQASTGGLLTTIGTSCAGAGGSVTTVSDGGFAPLFTTNVANPTTTPAITNTAINQYANTFLAGPSGTATDLVDFAIVNATGTASPLSISATPKQSGDIAMIFTVQDSNNNSTFTPDVSWTASTLNSSLQEYFYKVVSGTTTASASGAIGATHPNWAATEALFTAKPTFTPAVTNQANINSGACNFTNQAIGFTPTAGRTLIVAVMSGYTSFFGGPVNVTSFTDSVGDIFAPLSQITNSTGRGTEITLLAAYNIVGGATTFSCSQSGGMSNGTVDLFEVSNLAPIAPLSGPMTVRRIVPTDLPPVVSVFSNKNLAGDVSVGANALTTIDTITVTMPTSGGPWRAQVTYNYFFSGGVNGECTVSDGTTSWMQVEWQPLNNIGSCQDTAWSKTTYANGAAITFTVNVWDTGATTVKATSNFHTAAVSYVQVAIFATN